MSAFLLVVTGLTQATEHTDCPGREMPFATPPDLRLNGDNLESAQSAITLFAGQTLDIEFYPRRLDAKLRITPSRGRLRWHDENRATFTPTAPADSAGPVSALTFCGEDFYSSVSVWIAQPNRLTRTYPAPPRGQQAAYKIPSGLIRVDAAMATIPVSEHFTLGQFTTPDTPWPRYTLLSLALLEKLELTMRVLHQAGIEVSTLHILSAYRSPEHNARVGGATYSRHQYGDAVDFIVDADHDGRMDDLNQDGTVDREDLHWLTDRLQRRAIPVQPGGVGTYESSGPAQAFLHMDARGRPERWRQ